jgi:hypothetical protein
MKTRRISMYAFSVLEGLQFIYCCFFFRAAFSIVENNDRRGTEGISPSKEGPKSEALQRGAYKYQQASYPGCNPAAKENLKITGIEVIKVRRQFTLYFGGRRIIFLDRTCCRRWLLLNTGLFRGSGIRGSPSGHGVASMESVARSK